MRKGAAEEWFFSDARMVKEGRRIAATAFIRPKWSTAILQTSRMVYVSLFCVAYILQVMRDYVL